VESDNREDQLSGAHDWNRTSDLFLTKEVLYRLSYMSTKKHSDEINGAGDGNRTRTISLEG
jgi:hypothetical protein